jgi:DNA-directed RNA polymerase beta' subunit
MTYVPPHIRGGIKSILFGINDSEINEKKSYAVITNQSQLSDGIPVPSGVYDAHLGTFDREYNCLTCGNSKGSCQGHNGSINLGDARVLSPLFIKKIIKWLKIICPKCYKVAYALDDVLKIPMAHRLDKLALTTTSTTDEEILLKPCVHCNAERHSVKKIKEDKSAIGWVINKKTIEWIPPRQIDHIFNNISNETVALIGQHHPKKFVLSVIAISPVTARPETKSIESGRIRINDQTFFIKAIIADLENNKDNDKTLNQHYYEMVYGQATPTSGAINKNQPKSIKSLIPGKEQGLLRNKILGKRTFGTTRLVIVGDSSLEANQVGIPKSVACKLSIPEIVDISNRDRLMIYFLNATHTYPGCNKIEKSDGSLYYPGDENKTTLEIGDIVWRDLIDGDYILINRAPSLLPSSEVAMKIVIHNNNTMTFNVFICPLFNADFDGDAMTGYNLQTEGSKIEAKMVSSVDQFIISHKNSSAVLGQVQDSIIGLAQLSHSKVRYNKLSAMRAIGQTKLNPLLTQDEYSGRDLISMALEGDKININFSKKPNLFKEEAHLPYILPKYSADEREVVIKNGKHISGILDKTSIASGSSIYHVIYSQYGPQKSLDALYNMQQLAIHHIQREELTVGYDDLVDLVDNNSINNSINNKTIDELVELVNIENEKQIDMLDNGEILAPIGVTIESHFKEIQINIARGLNPTEHMMETIDFVNNNFYKMIAYGSKGKFPNLQLMKEIIGLILVNEKMPPDNFGYKRTSPYSHKCDLALSARGFIKNSYKTGMNVEEALFNAEAERHSIIMKALFTAVIGTESRTAGKNFESIIINNLRQCVNGNLLLQPIYAGDGVDPRKLIQVKLLTLLISDEDLEKDWGGYGEYSAQIKKERDIMRQSFMKLYRCGNYNIMSGQIMAPIDVQRIIDKGLSFDKVNDDKVNDNNDVDKINDVNNNNDNNNDNNNNNKRDNKPINIQKLIDRIQEYCNFDIYYVMMNEYAKKIKADVPEYLKTATTLCRILIRSTFKPAILEKLASLDKLNILLDQITFQYQNSLIDYGTSIGLIASQCTSEPLTQYVLHSIHHAVSGGTKKGGVAKFKEITSPHDLDRKDSIMSIYLSKEQIIHKNSITVAKKITNNIQILKLENFISDAMLVEELEYGKVVHPDLIEDKQIFEEYSKYYPLIAIPGNLIKWFFRFNIIYENLFLKNISLIKIVDSLRKLYKNSFIIHSNENSKNIIIRMYWKINNFKEYPTKIDMDEMMKGVLSAIIRGISPITNAIVDKKLQYLEIAPNGAVIKDRKEPVINTKGSNIYELLKSPISEFIDPLRITTDSIVEIWELFGIEAAKMAIIEELRKISPDVSPRHLYIYACEMCCGGNVTSIERSGLRARQLDNILLRIAHQAPIQALVYSAENNICADINSVSGALIAGKVPKIGTNYNDITVNESFVYHHTLSAEEQLAELGDI